jgi:ubiquitin C-terminal hydrolase
MRAVAPWQVWKVVARHSPDFTDFTQHDAHDFLTYFLTTLHQDLNQATNTKELPLNDGFGRPDELTSNETWDKYLARNRSILIDEIHGQSKVTINCPTCQNT